MALTPTTRYTIYSILMGLFVTPALVAAAIMLGLSTATWLPTTGQVTLGCALTALFTGAVGWWWGRRRTRPATWWGALWPVLAPPAFYLTWWVVALLVTGSLVKAAESFGFALPYLVVVMAVIFASPTSLLLPVLLVIALVASAVGTILGARRPPRPIGRRGLTTVLVAMAALVAVAGVQLAPHVPAGMLALRPASMEAEVPLWEYSPFDSTRLVTPDTPPSLTIAEQFPRLDGATALFPLYAAAGQAIYRPSAQQLQEFGGFNETYLACTTTPKAYQALINGQADAIFVLQPSAKQRAAAEAAGVQLDITPIGREAFVFFVHTDNPVTGLTLDQVRGIYSGQITSWRAVGGRDEPIVAFQRPEGSGSQTALQSLVMKDSPLAEPLREERVSGMGGIISEVAGYRDVTGAIGYSFRWYATVMNSNPQIRLLAIDGVAPTVDAIRDGSYPLVGDLNIVTAGSTNPHLPALVSWLTGPEGQALVEKVGYVPVSK